MFITTHKVPHSPSTWSASLFSFIYLLPPSYNGHPTHSLLKLKIIIFRSFLPSSSTKGISKSYTPLDWLSKHPSSLGLPGHSFFLDWMNYHQSLLNPEPALTTLSEVQLYHNSPRQCCLLVFHKFFAVCNHSIYVLKPSLISPLEGKLWEERDYVVQCR